MYGFEIYDRKSIPLDEKDLNKLDMSNCNDDYIFMRCPKCGAYMKFEGGPTNMLDGKYVCQDCDESLDETEAYDVLGEENDAFEEEMNYSRKRYYESDQSLYDICNGD